MKFQIEVTDTFNGEANYSWVGRDTLEVNKPISKLALVRRAKRIAGFNGYRCRKDEVGDTIALYPYGACIVMFITPCF